MIDISKKDVEWGGRETIQRKERKCKVCLLVLCIFLFDSFSLTRAEKSMEGMAVGKASGIKDGSSFPSSAVNKLIPRDLAAREVVKKVLTLAVMKMENKDKRKQEGRRGGVRTGPGTPYNRSSNDPSRGNNHHYPENGSLKPYYPTSPHLPSSPLPGLSAEETHRNASPQHRKGRDVGGGRGGGGRGNSGGGSTTARGREERGGGEKRRRGGRRESLSQLAEISKQTKELKEEIQRHKEAQALLEKDMENMRKEDIQRQKDAQALLEKKTKKKSQVSSYSSAKHKQYQNPSHPPKNKQYQNPSHPPKNKQYQNPSHPPKNKQYQNPSHPPKNKQYQNPSHPPKNKQYQNSSHPPKNKQYQNPSHPPKYKKTLPHSSPHPQYPHPTSHLPQAAQHYAHQPPPHQQVPHASYSGSQQFNNYNNQQQVLQYQPPPYHMNLPVEQMNKDNWKIHSLGVSDVPLPPRVSASAAAENVVMSGPRENGAVDEREEVGEEVVEEGREGGTIEDVPVSSHKRYEPDTSASSPSLLTALSPVTSSPPLPQSQKRNNVSSPPPSIPPPPSPAQSESNSIHPSLPSLANDFHQLNTPPDYLRPTQRNQRLSSLF